MKGLFTSASFAIAVLFALSCSAQAQERVANYETGKIGTKNYERFSFWVKDGSPSEIDYGYGKDWYDKNIKPTFEGSTVVNGVRGFKLQMPSGQVLSVAPQGRLLRITDAAGKYSKVFRWAYEGPVNGRGTYCTPCAQDPKEAMELMRTTYLK